ncbi:MAG: hypothetical protein NXI31_00205 [bacterium]|nr:hypothetical protein [bacterium]
MTRGLANRRRSFALLAAFAVAAVAPSCIGYIRSRVNEPVPTQVLTSLRIGQDDLGACLAALGAPVHVFEYDGDGMVLLWSWQDIDDWSLDVSVPVTEFANAEFELDLTATERLGCVLWFGPDLVLSGWRRGQLGDLVTVRQPPRYIE